MLGLLKRTGEAADINPGVPPITPRLSWLAEPSSPHTGGLRKSPGTDLTQGTPPRPRYTRKAPTPVRFAVGGPWALKECEEHTTWVNETLRRANISLIDDLRRAVSDGVTLVRLLGALEQTPVPGAETNRSLTRSEVLVNIYRCLSYLADRQVDTAGLDAEDLANGDLRSTLLLVANIRKKYDSGYGSRSEGDGGVSSPGKDSDTTPWLHMPGRITVEGGQPQPRGPPPPIKKDKPLPPQRRSAFGAPIPGVIGREEGVSRPASTQNIVSRTEVSSNGVAQFGVEERRQFMAGNPFQSASRGQDRGTTGLVGQERPPQAVTNAWGAAQYHAHTDSNHVSSVEDRLKNLIDTKPHVARPAPQHEEGELLVPPSPTPRGYDDTVNSGYYRGGYPGLGHPGMTRHPGQTVGYVPSKPSERRLGSRVDTIIENSNAKLPPPYPKPQPSPRQPYDNPAFTTEEQDAKQSVPVTPRAAKGGGDDLRSAWNRLYGAPEWRPATNQPMSHNQNQTQNPTQSNSYYGVFTLDQQNQHQQSQHQHIHHLHHQQPQKQQQRQQHPDQYHIQHQRKSSLDQLSTTVRISPTGQSSSTQGQQSGSASSSYSLKNAGFSTFKPEDDEDDDDDIPENSNQSPLSDQALGPSAKYPDQPSSRPSSARQGQGSSSNRQTTDNRQVARSLEQTLSVQKTVEKEHNSAMSRTNPQQEKSDHVNVFSRLKQVQDRYAPPKSPRTNSVIQHQTQSDHHSHHKVHPSRLSESNKSPHVNQGYIDSDNESEQFALGASESIFDYASESSSRSVTPPLPPLSPNSSPRAAPVPLSKYSRSYSASNVSPPKTPDLLSSTSKAGVGLDKRDLRASSSQIDMSGVVKHSKKAPRINHAARQHHRPRTNLSRIQAHSLEDLRESGNESNLSFDVENTMLMVEPESEQFSEVDISPKDAKALRQQLQGLESVYHQVLKQAGVDRSSARRRWSIGSSDTSSINRGRRFRSSASQRNHSRDIKAIQRRFQKLESHVVTLARSVAHLSSEMRNQTSLSHEMETVKKEMKELRLQHHKNTTSPLGYNSVNDFEKFRGWIPSLTNPKRVNKLTKFFGQEPPLLEIFLQKLGYERYAKNFASEHIGMIELPYMTEDRLQNIGIPMGPRLRILQEAQLCFRQENFNIYIV